MIFREIKITNQKPIKAVIPESWDDVTFSQFHKLMNESSAIKRVSILTGVNPNFFNKYPEMADFYVWIEEKLSWSNKWDEEESDCEVFLLGDEVFNFPKDIGVLSVGLYKDIQNEVESNKDDIISIYPLICASYYQAIRDGEYDYKKAADCVGMFNEQPCRKVFNAGGFFLSKVKKLRSGTKVGAKAKIIQMIKNWLALIGFQKYSGLKLYPAN